MPEVEVAFHAVINDVLCNSSFLIMRVLSIYCPPHSVENANSTRVRQWGYSLDELLSDRAGRNVFEEFCEKQCCAENIRFWTACDNLHCTSFAQVPIEVHNIYRSVSVSIICIFNCYSTLVSHGQITFSWAPLPLKNGLAMQD